MGRFIDISGMRFGSLLAIKVHSFTNSRECKWLCKCDCGNNPVVAGSYLRLGRQKKCEKCYRFGNLKRLKHGMSRTKIYVLWYSMKRRCYDTKTKNYKYWGGRGIKVCKRWHKFENFLEDMGERPKNKTLDRINNNKNYSKSNCRWATPKQQANNRRIRK